MGRRPNPLRRQQLLNEIIEYVRAQGLANLSLRPLANALGTSTYTLTYHFGSKQDLVDAIGEELARDEIAGGKTLSVRSASDQLLAQWEHAQTMEGLAAMRLLNEQLALAGRENIELSAVERRIHAPNDALAALLIEAGETPTDAERYATLYSAAMRGLIIDFMVTGERERVQSAVDSLIADVEAHTSAPALMSHSQQAS